MKNNRHQQIEEQGAAALSKKPTKVESMAWLRQQPGFSELCRDAYLDQDVQLAANRFRSSEEWQAIWTLVGLAPDSRVLDLGAARGVMSAAFTNAGCRVMALEPDGSVEFGRHGVRSLAEFNTHRLHPIAATGESMPAADCSQDLVYCRQVLHHTKSLDQVCQEVARVLRPKGRFLATREPVISKKSELEAALDAHPMRRWLPKSNPLVNDEHAFTLDAYIHAIRASGLRIRRILGPNDSVINYAPMPESEFRARVQFALSCHLGQKLARQLCKLSLTERLYARYWNWRAEFPGRLYSFLAEKV